MSDSRFKAAKRRCERDKTFSVSSTACEVKPYWLFFQIDALQVQLQFKWRYKILWICKHILLVLTHFPWQVHLIRRLFHNQAQNWIQFQSGQRWVERAVVHHTTSCVSSRPELGWLHSPWFLVNIPNTSVFWKILCSLTFCIHCEENKIYFVEWNKKSQTKGIPRISVERPFDLQKDVQASSLQIILM